MVIPFIAEKTLVVGPVAQQVALEPGVGMVIFLVTVGAAHFGDANVAAAGAQEGLPRAVNQMLVCNVADEAANQIWIVAAVAATVRQLEYSRP